MSLQYSYVEIETPKMMGLVGEAFEKSLNDESVIKLVPYKKGSEEISSSFCHVRI